MKVMHILGGYHKQKIYQELFVRLIDRGIDLEAYSHCEPHEIVKGDIPSYVHIYNHFNQFDRITFFGKQRKMIKDIDLDFEIENIDLIHAHTLFSSGYTAYSIWKKFSIPFIVAVRSVDINLFLKKMPHLKSVGLKTLLASNRIVFLNPVLMEEVINMFPSKYHEIIRNKAVVIPNGIDDVFHQNALSSRPEPDHNNFSLIMVAGFNENKNLEEVFNACERLICKHGKSVRLFLVGEIRDEKYRKEIEERTYVEYHEKCPHEQVITYLRKADIYVMPSHTETFGLVYAEALSQGMPIIYTRGQGFDGQFSDGFVGYSVSDVDVDELVEKILLVLENYNVISSRCVSASEKFNWNEIANKYVMIYREALHLES